MSAENQTPNAGTPAPDDQKPTAETCDLRSLGASHGWAEWAVSVVLIRHKPDGGLNVMNDLQRVRARSEDEAKGRAIRVSMGRLPEHLLHCSTILKIADVPNEKVSRCGENVAAPSNQSTIL